MHNVLQLCAKLKAIAFTNENLCKKTTYAQQVDRVFRKMDLNQDGVITIEEFLEVCLKDEAITRALQMFDNDI